MNIDLIINIIIPVAGIILLRVVVPLFKEKTTAKQRENIYFWVTLAVKSAEQIYDYKHAGQDKKGFVLDFMKNQNIDITEEELDVIIEAVVLELNLQKQE